MKIIVTILIQLFILNTVNASSFNKEIIMLEENGFIIKSIHIIKFPYERNGKKFDKNSNPDLYVKLFLNNKKIGKSNVIKNAKRGRIPILSGGTMPFRIERSKIYYLQLFDYDKDRVRKNKDEEVSSKIKISYDNLVSKYGKKNNYLIKDSQYGDVSFIIMVEHVEGSTIKGTSAYIKNVKPIDQFYIPPKNKVLEGCGPVAAAMVMGYWQTEQGYKIMNPEDRFDGTKHPTKTILDFRKKSNTRAWGNQSQSATRKMKMKDALESYVNSVNKRTPSTKARLKVDMMWSIRSWSDRRSRLKKELREGSPVILLLKKTPPCLEGKWVNKTKVVADHYIVAVGFDDTKKEYYVMPGWQEKPKSTSSGPQVHKRENKAHCKCSYKEIKNSDPSLIWIKR